MKKIFTHSEANELFKFRCQLKWSQLYGKSPSDTERYCGSCQQNVYLCENETELLEHAKQGHCVAIATEIPPFDRYTFIDGEPPTPCESMWAMGFVNHGFIFYVIEREDGAESEVFSYGGWSCVPPISQDEPYQGQELLKKEWHSTNETFKTILLAEENQVSCRNKERIYQLKELLAWVDEAIAAGLKWRFKMRM